VHDITEPAGDDGVPNNISEVTRVPMNLESAKQSSRRKGNRKGEMAKVALLNSFKLIGNPVRLQATKAGVGEWFEASFNKQ